ncbi:MAG: hypothetical protein ACMXYK_03225 [Candidatus Woesearchaeota archaeon]
MKNPILYSILVVFFFTILVVQIVYILPQVMMHIATIFEEYLYYAVSTMLSQLLLFVLLIMACAMSLNKWHGN